MGGRRNRRLAKTGRRIADVEKFREWIYEPSQYEKAMAEIKSRRARGDQSGVLMVVGYDLRVTE